MIHKIAHYKVRQNKLGLVKPVIESFVAAVKANERMTYYAAYSHTEDPTRYVHIMSFPDEAAEKKHQTAVYTKQFVSVLYPNCEESPVFTDLVLRATT